jgi:hypothetical protein
MAFGAGRLTEGRDQDAFRFIHLFLRRRWRLRGVDLRSGVASCPLLRIRSVLEGVVVTANMVLVTVPLASQGLFGG